MRGVIFRFTAPLMYFSAGLFSPHVLGICYFSSRGCGSFQYVLHEKGVMSYSHTGNISSMNDKNQTNCYIVFSFNTLLMIYSLS